MINNPEINIYHSDFASVRLERFETHTEAHDLSTGKVHRLPITAEEMALLDEEYEHRNRMIFKEYREEFEAAERRRKGMVRTLVRVVLGKTWEPTRAERVTDIERRITEVLEAAWLAGVQA